MIIPTMVLARQSAASTGPIYVIEDNGANFTGGFLKKAGAPVRTVPVSSLEQSVKEGIHAGSQALFVISAHRPANWSSEKDSFVPQWLHRLDLFTKNPHCAKVIVVIDQPSAATNKAWYRNELVPLASQAAREAGADIMFASSDTTLMKVKLTDRLLNWPAVVKGWSATADSFQPDEGEASHAVDGDPSTYWHTEYDPQTPKYPHELTVDTGSEASFIGFRYLPRQDGGSNGIVAKFKLEVSTDGVNWESVGLDNATIKGTDEAVFAFKSPIKARWYRFTALSEQTKGPYASGAEIELIP